MKLFRGKVRLKRKRGNSKSKKKAQDSRRPNLYQNRRENIYGEKGKPRLAAVREKVRKSWEEESCSQGGKGAVNDHLLDIGEKQ